MEEFLYMQLQTSITSQLISLKFTRNFYIIVFCILFISIFFFIPYEDSFYYWDWGRHLALSYFDGPPLIAYVMKIFATIFGHNIYMINFLGLLSIYLTIFFIYKICINLFADVYIAALAGILWLISPLVIQFQFLSVTYDNTMMMMWAATMYVMTRYIKDKSSNDIYLIGLCCALLLLSKYTGIILIFAFLLFILLTPHHWEIFLNKHTYISVILALLLFSPVIFWNYQYDWVSFKYQLNAHLNTLPPFNSLIGHLSRIIEQLNLLFLFPLFGFFYYYKTIKQDSLLIFLYVVFFFTTLFLLNLSLHHKIAKHWLTPICISNVIIYSYFLTKFHMRKLFFITMITYIVTSSFYLISYIFFQSKIDRPSIYTMLIPQSDKIYHQYHLPIVTTSWQLASKLAFHLPNQPQVYSLECGPTNEYRIWSEKFIQDVKKNKVKEILYYDYNNQIPSIVGCVNNFFANCMLLQTLDYKNTTTKLNVYRCYK